MHPRGDVELKLDGETYTLRGTFKTMADYQAELDVVGLSPIVKMIGELDARALLYGVKCLAVVGDVSKVDDLPFNEHEAAVQVALLNAITGGLDTGAGDTEDEGDTEGNPQSEGKK